MRVHPTIFVYNESTVMTDAEIQAALPIVKKFCDYHFQPVWNATAALTFVSTGALAPTGPLNWQAHFLDNSDQAGALGYHYLDSAGNPQIRVFAETDQKYGLDVWVTFTHELWEALVDPTCLVASQHPTINEFYAYEVGDPVESDSYAGIYSGIKMSDFVTPAWYDGIGTTYDYFAHCSKPHQVLSGGYVSIYKNGSWGQYQMQETLVPTTDHSDPDKPRLRNRAARHPAK